MNRLIHGSGLVILCTGVFFLGALATCVQAQNESSVPPIQSQRLTVAPAADGAVSGTLYLADYGLGNTSFIVISLEGASGTHPAHLHSGDCGSGGPIVVPLESVDGTTGLSVTVTTTPLEAILGADHYLNIHASAEDMGTIIACAEVGEGAPAATSTETAETAPAASGGDAAGGSQEEFEAQIPTAGYGIFAVENSGVSGQVQVAGRAEGGTRIVLSLQGTEASKLYPVEIRRGNCGPDGELLFEMSFPLSPAEPGVGEAESELSFSTLAEADNYLSIYAPDGSGTVLACGEVGTGANR